MTLEATSHRGLPLMPDNRQVSRAFCFEKTGREGVVRIRGDVQNNISPYLL